MKYIKFIYIILIASIGVFWAIYFLKKDKKFASGSAKTEVVVTNKIINKGISKYNQPVTAEFELLNAGEQKLLISEVQTDCECTASQWKHEPVLPQHKTKIKVVYNGSSMGYFQKKVIVTCNAENSPILLILRGNIIE